MEYSIWSFFGAIWSALGFNSEVKLYCHMEYSIWLFYDAIWSTPYGRNLRVYGVLHTVVKNVYYWRNTKHSTKLIAATPWSTPCGHYFMPHGVLHMVSFWCHMDCFRIHHRGEILLPYGVLHMVVLWCHMEYSIWQKSKAIWLESPRRYIPISRMSPNLAHSRASLRLIFSRNWTGPFTSF